MNQVQGRRGGLAVLLLGTGAAWNAGNVGPVVPELESEFGLSLTTIGILSGTLFFASMIGGIVFAPPRAGSWPGSASASRASSGRCSRAKPAA